MLQNQSSLFDFSNSPEEVEDSLFKERKENQVNTITTATEIQNVPIASSMAFVLLKRTLYRSVSSTGGENGTEKHRGHSLLPNKSGMLFSCEEFLALLSVQGSASLCGDAVGYGILHPPCAHPYGNTLASRNHVCHFEIGSLWTL